MVRLLQILGGPHYIFIPSPFIPPATLRSGLFFLVGQRLLPFGWATGPASERVIARQLPEAKNISKALIALQLEASRIQAARFLDPENSRVATRHNPESCAHGSILSSSTHALTATLHLRRCAQAAIMKTLTEIPKIQELFPETEEDAWGFRLTAEPARLQSPAD